MNFIVTIIINKISSIAFLNSKCAIKIGMITSAIQLLEMKLSELENEFIIKK